MLTLVTGATGFIGRHLAQRLLESRQPVTILTRDRSRVPLEWRNRVNVAIGDLRDKETLKPAFEGVSVLYHLAGEIRDPALFRPVNEQGVRVLLETADHAGVAKVIHLSSVGVIGAKGRGVVTEDNPCEPKNEYERSKYAGERIVLEWAERGRFQAVVVRPTTVFGEGKRGRDSLLEWLRAIQQGRFVFIGAKGIANYVYVEDVVDACIQLAGKPYGLTGPYIVADPTTIHEFVAAGVVALGVSMPRITVPVWLAYALAAGLQTANRVLGTQAPLTVSRVQALTSEFVFSGRRLYDTYGVQPRIGFREGLIRTVRWYRDMGML